MAEFDVQIERPGIGTSSTPFEKSEGQAGLHRGY